MAEKAVLKIVEGLMIGERRVVSKDKTRYAASMMVRVIISASEEEYVDVYCAMFFMRGIGDSMLDVH